MNKKSAVYSVVGLLVLLCMGVLFALDFYASALSDEVANTILKSEASSLQQGNLISSFTKLQSAINTSENLRGISVYDLRSEVGMQMPLISLGQLPDLHNETLKASDDTRLGIFNRLLVRKIQHGKVLVFYFEFRILKWVFLGVSGLILLFLIVVIYLGRQIESVRANERAEVLVTISQQISHDIKSPLSALNIVSGVYAKKGISTELLDSGIQRISEIIEDLKVKSGSLGEALGSKEKFRLDSCLRQVVAEKVVQYPDYNLKVGKISEALTVGSPVQFKRVLSNLINNAVEASPSGSAIEIELDRAQNGILLVVRDSGSGISEMDIKNVFSKGYSVGKTNGSGLGLFHAKEVVEAMNGKIELNSELGVGTQITIHLKPAFA